MPSVVDGIEFIHSEDKAGLIERNWVRQVNWYKNHPEQYPDGFHHQGMHWTDIYNVLPVGIYKPGVLRVAHFKLAPKHIKCLRKERLPNGRIRWVLSYHWEGHCPGCEKPTLAKREPVKLIRRPKLIRRVKE